MTVAVDATGTFHDFATGAGPFNYTGITVGASLTNGALIAFICTSANFTTTSLVWDPTGANQAMTLIGSKALNNAAANGSVYLYGLLNPASGNNTLQYTFTGTGGSGVTINAQSYTGVTQSSFADAFANFISNSAASGTTASVSVTNSSGDICVALHGTSTLSAVNQTQIYKDTVAPGNDNAANRAAGTGSPITLSATISSGAWASVGVDIVAAGAVTVIDTGSNFLARPWAQNLNFNSFLWQNPATDVPVILPSDNPQNFVAKFTSTTPRNLALLRQNAGTDIVGIAGSVTIDALGSNLVFTTAQSAPVDYTGITVGTGGNRALVLYLGFLGSNPGPGGTVSATWDSGGANQLMTQLVFLDDQASNGAQLYLFGLLNPLPGNRTLEVFWTNGQSSQICANAISFYGVDQDSIAAAFPNGQSTTGSSASPTINISSLAGHIPLAMTELGGVGTLSSPNLTSLFLENITSNSCAGQYTTSPTSATSFTWIASASAHWGAIAVDVAPAPGTPVAVDINSSFIAKFTNPVMNSPLQLRQHPSTDLPTLAVIDNPQNFIGKFKDQPLKRNNLVRQNGASNASFLPVQAPTQSNFFAKFKQQLLVALPLLRQNPSTNVNPINQISNPPSFTARFAQEQSTILSSLYQGGSNDQSVLPTQVDNPKSFIARFNAQTFNILPLLRQNFNSDITALTAALRAVMAIQTKIKGGLSGTVPLASKVSIQTKAKGTGSLNAALSGKLITQTKAFGTAKLNAALAALTSIRVKASGAAAGVVPLVARTSTKVKGAAAIAGKIALKGTITAQTKAFGTATRIIQLTGRMVLQTKSVIHGNFTLALSGTITAITKASLSYIVNPAQGGYKHIVKFIQNVGHLLIR